MYNNIVFKVLNQLPIGVVFKEPSKKSKEQSKKLQ